MHACPILSANSLPARSPIQLSPSCNRLSNTGLDTRCDSNHAPQMGVLKKIPRFSLSDCVHSPKAQALPSNFNSSQNRWSNHPSKHLFSISSELLQQRTGPCIRRSGRSRSWLPTPCYQAIESSLSYSPSHIPLLTICSMLLSGLIFLPKMPWLPPHASKPPSFINAARSFIIIRSRHTDSISMQSAVTDP
jgi:hypothetical protein